MPDFLTKSHKFLPLFGTKTSELQIILLVTGGLFYLFDIAYKGLTNFKFIYMMQSILLSALIMFY